MFLRQSVLVFLGCIALFSTHEEYVNGQGFLAGGLTEARAADADSQSVADQVREAVQNLLGRTFTRYVVLSYRVQVVAGTNYYIKVLIQDTQSGQYVAHLQVFQSLQGVAILNGLMFPNMWNDPITYSGYRDVKTLSAAMNF